MAHDPATSWLATGGGEMGERLRAFDWHSVSIGPPEKWPAALRVAVDLCLDNRYPMHVWWGPELINIYNDAHIPVLGKRHPSALCRPAPCVWNEVWHVLLPQVEAVCNRGEATWNERAAVTLERNGYSEAAWFTWSYSPVREASGAIAGLICIAIEETGQVIAERERERLAVEQQQLRANERAAAEAALRESTLLLKGISDSTGDVIFAKDREGRLRFANPATLTLLGRPLEQVLGRTDAELLSDASAAQTVMENDRRIMESGLPADIEEVVPMPDGSRRVWLSRKMPNRDAAGRIVGLLGVSRDITEQKQIEEALLRQTDELARSNLELERFAYVASHDLQEPVRTVCRFAQLLTRRCGSALDVDGVQYLRFITDGAERMQALIVALLEYSRLGSDSAPLALADCNQICKAVLENLQATVQLHGTEVILGALPIVMGDATQLGQLFQNLLSNAIKFHGSRPPRVTVSAIEAPTEWIFSIADNGIGIAREYFERIFVIFQRLHSVEEFGGTGIGLAVCKKIVERHRGRIWVQSVTGKGSTFYFSIPKGGTHAPSAE